MKWIYALLLFISSAAIGQVDDTTKYISYQNQYGMKMPRVWAPTTMIMPSGDTTGRRPEKIGAFMTCTCDGNVYRWNGANWVAFSGLLPSDTTNKWVNSIRRRPGTDTVEYFKNGSWQHAFIDSTGPPEWVSVLDYGARANDTLTDYTSNIQAAIASGAKTVLFPAGTYIVTSDLLMNSNQTLLGYGAKLLRKHTNVTRMIINESDGSVGGYDADSNMSVIGFSLDGNSINYPTALEAGITLIGFGHARNILIKDCDLTNTLVFHCIEVNGCKNVLMDNLNCHDYVTPGREAIQIDLMGSSTLWGAFGPYDSTACENVTIQNCKFINGDHGFGSHSQINNHPHRNVTVKNCTFRNLRGVAIIPFNYNGLVVDGNYMDSCLYGVNEYSQNNNTIKYSGNYRITNNHMRKLLRADASPSTQGSGMIFKGTNNIIVANNVLDSINNWGIGFIRCDSVVVANNIINNFGAVVNTENYGIYMAGSSNFNIRDNTIKTITNTDAIVLRTNSSVTPKNGIIAGNIIQRPNLLGDYYQFSQYAPLQCTNCLIGKNIINDTIVPNTRTINADYTLGGTEGVINANTNDSALIVTLNPALIQDDGIIFVNTGINDLTLVPSTGTINGQSSVTVDSTILVKADGKNYYAVSSSGGSGGGGMAIGGTVTSGTNGSALFIDAGNLGQDNANFFFDAMNKRLGVGTNTPQGPLHVYHPSDSRIVLSNTTGADNLLAIAGSAPHVYIYNRANGFIDFATNNTSRMLISAAGNVGINKSTPSAKLHVDGNVKFDLGSDATGDIFYRNSGGEITRLGVGSNGNVLTLASGLPSWAAPASSITSINSQTGPAITIQGGTGTSVNTTTNTITVEVVPSSTALAHTLDVQYTTQGNSGTSETDLYSYTLPANKLAVDGRTINFEIDGEVNDNTATAQIKLYFAGNTTLNTGAINISSANTGWRLKGYIIRTSSTTAHVTYELHAPGLATPVFVGYNNLTSLDFTSGNILKVSAQAGGAGGGSSDITAHSWQVTYRPIPL